MSEPALLAEHIDQHYELILAVWRTTVDRVGDVPESEKLSLTEFNDHVPALLERLAERLRGQPSDAAEEGQKHGRVRWKQGYDISEVVKEFGHLHTALTRSTSQYAQENGWDIPRLEAANEVINDVLAEATAESVRQFQEDGRAATEKARSDVKRQQDALEDAWINARREQMKVATILASLPVAVWVVNAEGDVVAINHEAERLRPFSSAETAGWVNVHRRQDAFPTLRPDGTPCPTGDLPIVRALQGEVVKQEELIWDIGGESRHVSVNAAPLTDAEGVVIGAVGVVQDITARKQLEASLSGSEARFRVIAELSPVMIWRAGPDGLCDYVNQTYTRFIGRPLEESLGERWLDVVHPEDREEYARTFHAAFHERRPFEETFRVLRHDGQYRWIATRGTPYFDSSGQFLGYLGSCLDITPRIELEKLLEQQKELAEEGSRHKSRLVSALSHDARTPLNAVVLAAQLLEIHFDGHVHAEVQECLRTIRHSVRNVLDLLGDLLDLSRIDAGALPAELSRFPLEPVLAECLASIEPQGRQKGLEVRFEPGSLAGVSLETDRAKLKQILANLLSNALNYTRSGHIRLYGERTAEQVRIHVEDTGTGIAPSDHARIFEEFATLDHPQRKAGEGTGLGLAICRRLVNLLRGEITLQSTPGAGSTFTIVFPVSVLTLTPPVIDQQVGLDAPGSGSILVVEDHVDSRQTLAKVLRRMGYRVLEASNGRDALARVEQERPLAVLMDVNMPIMDGIEATLALRTDPRFADLPIFALTGDVTLVNQHRIGEAGVNGYLEKPVTWEALRQALSTLNEKPKD